MATSGWAVDPVGSWTIHIGARIIQLDGLSSVLYRRPVPPRLPGVGVPERSLIRSQWQAMLDGLQALEAVAWVNPPMATARAESKILQLRAARDAGFAVPETLVTNTREEALSFAAACGGLVICKGLDAPLLPARCRPRFVFSTLLHKDDLRAMQEEDLSPVILQRPILPKTDIRVTVVGNRVLAAATRSSEVDWRLDAHAVFKPIEVPAAVISSAVALVRHLELRFAGIDLLLDEQGRYWFLELNPQGEWGWLQAAGLPVAEALAGELLNRRAAL